jgi:acyl-CoA synthetase (NDP forming)
VEGFGVWVEAMMAFSMLPSSVGDRMAIISGPGGLAVSTAEACGRAGLRLAEISHQTKEALAEFVPPTGTSLHNPIDVGLTASFDVNMYYKAATIVASDPGVDTIVVVGSGIDPETNRLFIEKLIQVKNETRMPFVMVSVPGFDPSMGQTFCQAGIPFYETTEQAMNTYARVLRYHLWRQGRDL